MIPNDLTFLPAWLEGPLASFLSSGEQTPHALLIHGPAGIGKRLLGRAVARSLLCEAASRTPSGCGMCAACLWFGRRNHPDFRRITSDVNAATEGADLDEDDGAEDNADADADAAPSRSKRAPSKEIRIEQVRALQRFLSVGTHRAGARVLLLYPLEALNEVAANALLKMLEEPPPRTVFILIADHLGRIPATIVSRCQRLPLALPDPTIAAAWLRARMPDRPDEAAAALALAGGAPLAALAYAEDADAATAHRALTGFLARPSSEAAMALAESFARSAPAPVVHGMQRWLADCLATRLAGRLRYHPTQADAIARLVSNVPLDGLVALCQRVAAVRRTVAHPLNVRLLLEGLFSAYADAMTPRVVRPGPESKPLTPAIHE